MAYEMKHETGSMFENDKSGNPNRPDYKGSILVGGKEWRLSGWLKTSAKGTRWLSLKAEEPFQKQNQQPEPPQSKIRDEDVPAADWQNDNPPF